MGISKSYLKELAKKKKYQSGGFSTEDKQFSVKKSTIPGANKGLFSKTPIKQGKLIGLAHENNQPVGTLGNMHNHSETPNMQSVKIGNQRYVYATRDIQPGEELTTNYRLQPELEQPEDFMGNKRFGQKGFYKPDFRTKSQIAAQQGNTGENTKVAPKINPVDMRKAQEAAVQRAIANQPTFRQGRILSANEQAENQARLAKLKDQQQEEENRRRLTFTGNAEARGAGTLMQPLLDVLNPFSYYYSGKDALRGVGQVAEGISNLDLKGRGLDQIGSGLTQAGLNTLYVLPAASELKPALKGAGKYLTTQTPLKNTYKINPFAFKPDPNSFYRQIGNTGLKDALESGVIRSADQTTFPRPHFVEGKDFKNLYSTGSGAHGKPSVIFETSGVNAEGMPIVFPTHVSSEYAPWISGTSEIPLSQGRLLQKDWLKGYKPVEVPKQSFKSEIDWGKWNPETPKYPELINEYNAIEQSTKKAGTWMKNPDGSVFQGTPEQFIQQQSSYFKKAFPSPLRDEAGNVQFTYHGSPNTFDVFDENMVLTGRTRGHGIYTSPSKEKAASYAKEKDGKLYEFYQNASKKQDKLANLEKESNERFAQFLKDNPKNSPDFDKKLKAFMDEEDKLYNALDIKEFKLQPGYDFYKANADEYVVPFTNYPKSAVGNVGFFDMTNPNIYKGVLPYALPLGAGLGTGYMMQNQKPKGTYQGGGTRGPIYVSNPNDPRLKRYNDSLSGYNMTKAAEAIFRSNPYNPILEQYNRQGENFIRRTGIKPTRILTASEGDFDYGDVDIDLMQESYLATFKKPVQPVMLDPLADIKTIKSKGLKTTPTNSAPLAPPTSVDIPMRQRPIPYTVKIYDNNAKEFDIKWNPELHQREVIIPMKSPRSKTPAKHTKNYKQAGGTIDDVSYMNFVKTLPPNLAQPNDPSYNLRGYWNALGNPESFDYNQPTDDQGYYHAFSRDPRTGQILKAPFHPSFKEGVNEESAYRLVNPRGDIYTQGFKYPAYEGPYALPKTDKSYDFLDKPNYEGYFQGGGTMGIPGVNGQVVSSGPTPLTSVKKTRGSMSMDNEGNIKTMPKKAVKKILKNIK